MRFGIKLSEENLLESFWRSSEDPPETFS